MMKIVKPISILLFSLLFFTACNEADPVETVAPTPEDIYAPVVTITAPAQYAYTGDTVDVKVDAQDSGEIREVYILIDGDSLAGDNQLPFEFQIIFDGPETSHTLLAKARDGSGNLGISQLVTVYTVPDLQAPVLFITQPAAYSIVGEEVIIRAEAMDNIAVETITFYIDGDSLASASAPPYEVTWSPSGGASYSIYATARDRQGNIGYSQLVTVYPESADMTAPIVFLTHPAAYSLVGEAVTIRAEASDNVAVEAVTFYVDGDSLTSVATPPYEANWSPAGGESYSIYATARDAQGNIGYSQLISVYSETGDEIAPVVVITAPINLSDVSGTIAVLVQASDNEEVVQVEYFVDGLLAGTENTAPFTWNWDTGTVPNGLHSLLARAYDAAGNSSISQLLLLNVQN